MSSHNTNEPNFPTPYIAQVQKVMPSGTVTIRGNSAPTVEAAIENLQKTRQEYYESGGWGGAR